MTTKSLIRTTFPVGALGCNCTILGDPVTGDALVVDPGDDADLILARLKKLGLQARALVHTHAHFDHVGATAAVASATGATINLHQEDLFLYNNLDMQGRMFGFSFDAVRPVDRFVVDGDTVGAGRTEVEVLHTPGHTPGSVCFRHAGSEPVLFSGDTLFAGGIGRTDLWGGDFPTIKRSIRERLYTLAPDTVVIPGHGPETTIGDERANNGFVRG